MMDLNEKKFSTLLISRHLTALLSLWTVSKGSFSFGSNGLREITDLVLVASHRSLEHQEQKNGF